MIGYFVDSFKAIFGTYEPLIDPVSGSYVDGFAGADWSYILAGFAFCLALWGVFKIFIAIFSRRR